MGCIGWGSIVGNIVVVVVVGNTIVAVDKGSCSFCFFEAVSRKLKLK